MCLQNTVRSSVIWSTVFSVFEFCSNLLNIKWFSRFSIDISGRRIGPGRHQRSGHARPIVDKKNGAKEVKNHKILDWCKGKNVELEKR